MPSSERIASVQVGEPGGDVTLSPAEYTYVTTPGVNLGKLATVTVGARVTTYTYDASGNLTSVAAPTGTTEYTAWDALGRPTSMLLPGGRVVTQTYDAMGAPKRVTPPGNGAGSPHVHELAYTPARRLASYVAPDVTPPMLLASRTTTYAYGGDHLGSLRSVVDVATGAAAQTMEHGPWGEVLAESVTAGFERVPFGFAGGLYDDATGLVRFGAREYDPSTGRWLTKDEARFGGGWNFYEYAGGDPVNFVDRTGFDPTFGECTKRATTSTQACLDVCGSFAGRLCGALRGDTIAACEDACRREGNYRLGACILTWPERGKPQIDYYPVAPLPAVPPPPSRDTVCGGCSKEASAAP